MSRWGAEQPMRDSYLYVLDPDTLGEPLSHHELSETAQDVARMHVGQTLEGMGYTDLAYEFVDARFASAVRPRITVAVELDEESSTTYLGVIAGPFGLMPVSLAEARGLASSLPQVLAQQVKFVGLDTDVIRRLRDKAKIEPRGLRQVGGIQIGPDGLVFAPLNRIVPREATI